MLSFHNDSKIKATYLARVQAHALADEIIHGAYWQEGKGCAVGCTIHGSDHAKYETELGIPRILARLEDRIFEGLANAESKTFPSRFLSAIPVGADLSMVWPKFAAWLLVGCQRHTKKDSAQWIAIQRVADLYLGLESWDKRDKSAFRDAAAAAYAAAGAGAYAAAYAAAAADAGAYAAAYAAAAAAYAADAADAAAYAADAAAYAAAAAAYAAAAAAYAADAAAYAAAGAARKKSYKAQADKLIELLSEA